MTACSFSLSIFCCCNRIPVPGKIAKQISYLMILEAEKSKNTVLTSAEGSCTQSFHCGKRMSGERERRTGFGQVSPNTYAEGLGPRMTLLSLSHVREI